LHNPLIYRKIHKQHHQYKNPIASADIFMHPIEYILLSIVPGTNILKF
jgi:sterol desaturase/sphingolipid hydroxylase (fatty acid hydroxylase superfamily)